MLTIAPRCPSPSSGSVFAIAAADSRTMLKVPRRLTRITNSKSFCGIGSLLRSTVRPARPIPAEFTSTRSGPISQAAATAVTPSFSFDTSHFTKMPPISLATAEPRSSCRSATTIRAPNAASCRADASPMPDAPPVTIPEAPCRSRRGISDPLDDRGVGEPAALTHRLKPVPAARPLELVEQRRHQLRARRTQRMPERDRAAVDVGPGEVGAVLLLPRQHHRGERLVDLEQIDLVERQSRPLHDLRRRRDRPLQHRHRIGPDHRETVEAGAWPQAERLRLLGAHDQYRRRAIGDLRRIAGGDLAVLLECRLQVGERLHRRAFTDPLIASHHL